MKKALTLLACWFISGFCFAQYSSPSKQLKDDLQTLDYSRYGTLGKKGSSNPKPCTGDTLDYARYKAGSAGLTAVNVSSGFALGQYFDAPGEVTISGFDFYAWQTQGRKDTITLYCYIYDAGIDSLPSGPAVRADTIRVDSTFGAGLLSVLLKRAEFSSSYTTKKPYLLVVESRDTIRVGVVCNSYTARAGANEWLASGTVGSRWFNSRYLNIGGTPLNCDIALEPHVKYKFYNDFSFTDCYNFKDTLRLKNTSSPFVFSKMYNRYKYFNIEQFCHLWDYDNGFRTYIVDGKPKYNQGQNLDITLTSMVYAFRGGGVCRDTTTKQVSFQPSEILLTGDSKVCSGESAVITAASDGEIHWYAKQKDTISLHTGTKHVSGILDSNLLIYSQAHNKHCSSNRRAFLVNVLQKPTLPSVTSDSICLNAKALLSASTDAGSIYWYTDSSSNLSFFEGDVLEIGPFLKDTFFFVKAINGICSHDGKVKVSAFVSSDFAPSSPIVSNDTTICLLDGAIDLKASSPFDLSWFTTPNGGKPISTDSTFSFVPKAAGISRAYVEAFDGRCPSSRVPIKINVHHFGKIVGKTSFEDCSGSEIEMDFAPIAGSLYWYSDSTTINPDHTGTSMILMNQLRDTILYVQPFEGVCLDTARHKINVRAIPYGKVVSNDIDTAVCSGSEPTIELSVDYGKVFWFGDNPEVAIDSGKSHGVGQLIDDYSGFFQINNEGCKSGLEPFEIRALLQPDANFDFQVNLQRKVEFLSRLTGQGLYEWDFDDEGDTANGTDINYQFTKDGTFKVKLVVTTVDGCADTVMKEVTINTVGIDPLKQTKFTVYPNPNTGHFNVDLGSLSGSIKLELIDMTGKIIETLDANGAAIASWSPNVVSGLYSLRLSGENINATRLIQILR